MLNLAGVDLIVDSPGEDAISFINKYIELASYRPWVRPSSPPPLAPGLTFGWPRPEPSMKLNRFVWPVSASRWAFGHFLASSDQVADIMEKAYLTSGKYKKIVFKIGTPDVEPITDKTDPDKYGKDNIIVADMYVLPPTPLSGIRGLSGDTQSLYLISIVDERFFWYEASTKDMTVGASWDSLYQQVWTNMGATGAFTNDEISEKYLWPGPKMFTLSYQPAPFVLDAIAFNVGQRIVLGYDGFIAARNASGERDRLIKDFKDHPDTRIIMAGGAVLSNPL